MKGMPLPFDFQGKGVLDLDFIVHNNNNNKICSDISSWSSKRDCILSSIVEPTSVLDTTSSSTVSSSFGGGGSTGGNTGGGGADTADVAAVSGNNNHHLQKWQQDSTTATSSIAGPDLLPVPPSLDNIAGATTTAAEKCSMDEWESVLGTDPVVAPPSSSPGQEQSILRWIMGDVEDPSMGSLNKVLQIGSVPGPGPGQDFEFSGGFGVVDQSFGSDPVAQFGANLLPRSSSSPNFPSILGPITTNQSSAFSSGEMKGPVFNPQVLINQNQTLVPQNPAFFLPLSFGQHDQNSMFMQPQAKRHNPGVVEPGPIPKGPFSDELFLGRPPPMLQPEGGLPHQLQLLPNYQQRPAMGIGAGLRPKMVVEDNQQVQLHQQQAIIDQLYKAAELVQTGNPVLAQTILARLNHQLSPIGKPFHRAAFYFKEALSLLLHNGTNNNMNNPTNASPFSLIFKIGAYKSFSEISPLVQFSNFTCNQAVLEVIEGFDRIHVVDFDIGYGGQWASLMQELALRNGGSPALKITAFASPQTHDQLELGLTRENLIHFANEISIPFEFDIVNIESLSSSSWSMPFHSPENEAVVVNLPVSALAQYHIPVPLVLRFVKQLLPKIVVSVDRGSDRTDLPFPNHIIHALQSYSNLLESIDSVNVNMDALQKIERFLLQPGIEKVVAGRLRSPEKTQHWRTLFLSSGFSPVTFSNFTESQAECVVKRTLVRGFQIEKRQSSLVLCWQRKELISASAWRC